MLALCQSTAPDLRSGWLNGIIMQNITVCALYKFVRVENFEQLKSPLLSVMLDNDVKGTLLLANEGINGTIAGTPSGIDAV